MPSPIRKVKEVAASAIERGREMGRTVRRALTREHRLEGVYVESSTDGISRVTSTTAPKMVTSKRNSVLSQFSSQETDPGCLQIRSPRNLGPAPGHEQAVNIGGRFSAMFRKQTIADDQQSSKRTDIGSASKPISKLGDMGPPSELVHRQTAEELLQEERFEQVRQQYAFRRSDSGNPRKSRSFIPEPPAGYDTLKAIGKEDLMNPFQDPIPKDDPRSLSTLPPINEGSSIEGANINTRIRPRPIASHNRARSNLEGLFHPATDRSTFSRFGGPRHRHSQSVNAIDKDNLATFHKPQPNFQPPILENFHRLINVNCPPARLPGFVFTPRPNLIPRVAGEHRVDMVLDALIHCLTNAHGARPVEYWKWVRGVLIQEYLASKSADPPKPKAGESDEQFRREHVLPDYLLNAFKQMEGNDGKLINLMQKEGGLVLEGAAMAYMHGAGADNAWMDGGIPKIILEETPLRVNGYNPGLNAVSQEIVRKMEFCQLHREDSIVYRHLIRCLQDIGMFTQLPTKLRRRSVEIAPDEEKHEFQAQNGGHRLEY